MRMVNNMNKLIILAALVAACGKGKGGGDCNQASTAVDRMMAKITTAPGMPDNMKAEMKDRGDKLKAAIVKRCTEDKWSSEVIDCYAKAASKPEITACRGKLPPDQASALQAEEMQGMFGATPSPAAIQGQLDALGKQLNDAQQELTNATDDASRVAAKEKLNTIQKQALVLRAQLERAKSSANPMPPGHPGALGSAAPAPAGSAQ